MNKLIIMSSLFLASCSNPNLGKLPLKQCYVNDGIDFKKSNLNLIYRNTDPSLAGIVIYQSDPVNMMNLPPRNKKYHPESILYYFWDNSIALIGYDVNGRVIRKEYRSKAGSFAYVDFTYGSDPEFRKHKDPRIR